MAEKQGKQNQKRLVVTVRRVVTPDAEERLSRAIAILLKAAARDTSKSEEGTGNKKKEPPSQAPEGDALTGEDGECDNGNRRNLPDQ